MSAVDEGTDTTARTGSVLEVLRVFLRLGLTSFGGPVAHLVHRFHESNWLRGILSPPPHVVG